MLGVVVVVLVLDVTIVVSGEVAFSHAVITSVVASNVKTRCFDFISALPSVIFFMACCQGLYYRLYVHRLSQKSKEGRSDHPI